jgi:hypothetical protein
MYYYIGNMSVRYVLVTVEDQATRVPTVLEDYIYSMNIISDVIHISQLTAERVKACNDIYILTQMWLDAEALSTEIIQTGRIVYLNVEMLSELKRMNHVLSLLGAGIKVADYSLSNLTFLGRYMAENNLLFNNPRAYYLPYQYNLRDQMQLENIDGIYTYDVGIINALPKQDASVDPKFTYRRTRLWEQLQATGWNCINILGWGAARDEKLKRCKVIINVHHFECFNIFEQIRCDRLIFARKLVVSDKSIFIENYDLSGNVLWEEYDNIIPRTKEILENFDTYNSIIKSVPMDSIIANRQAQLSEACNKMK